jgi:hypothetical protein
MTNECALEEFKFAVNQWFRHMDMPTRQKAILVANASLHLPLGEVFHQEVVRKPVAQPFGYPGRGGMFVGKVWMLNRSTGERARVLPGEVADYVAKGFEKGGPRSK